MEACLLCVNRKGPLGTFTQHPGLGFLIMRMGVRCLMPTESGA